MSELLNEQSDIGGQLYSIRSMEKSLNIVIHEICHNDQMNDLRSHEPVTHILRQQTHSSISIELRIGENPEYYEKHS